MNLPRQPIARILYKIEDGTGDYAGWVVMVMSYWNKIGDDTRYAIVRDVFSGKELNNIPVTALTRMTLTAYLGPSDEHG